MATKSRAAVNEGTAYAIQLDFFDEDNNVVTPSGVTWWLTDLDGTVVNSRSSVSVDASSRVYIVTNSADNLLNVNASVERVIHVQAPYDSATLGNNLQQNIEHQYTITKLYRTPINS